MNKDLRSGAIEAAGEHVEYLDELAEDADLWSATSVQQAATSFNALLKHVKLEDQILAQLYARYDLAIKRAAEETGPTPRRKYWNGETTGLEIAIDLLGGTIDGR